MQEGTKFESKKANLVFGFNLKNITKLSRPEKNARRINYNMSRHVVICTYNLTTCVAIVFYIYNKMCVWCFCGVVFV